VLNIEVHFKEHLVNSQKRWAQSSAGGRGKNL